MTSPRKANVARRVYENTTITSIAFRENFRNKLSRYPFPISPVQSFNPTCFFTCTNKCMWASKSSFSGFAPVSPAHLRAEDSCFLFCADMFGLSSFFCLNKQLCCRLGGDCVGKLGKNCCTRNTAFFWRPRRGDNTVLGCFIPCRLKRKAMS